MNPATLLQRQLLEENINVSTAWLEACITYLRSENPARTLGQEEMRRLVFEQLLHSNLNDIRTSCLPSSIFTSDKVTLTGSYLVQLEELKDISQPAYSQLRKITGSENANVTVQAEPREGPARWEGKITRMLKLSLSDGVNKVSAFEYELVPALNISLLPGTKLVISGPVECRKSVLFLTRKSVRVLGGCVEALTAENSQEAVLRRALGPRALQGIQSNTTATTNQGVATSRQVSSSVASGNRPQVRAGGGPPNTTTATGVRTPAASPAPVQLEDPLDEIDEDDELLGQIDIDAIAEAPLPEDESVDEDVLREQLDFQANAENLPPSTPSPPRRPVPKPSPSYVTLSSITRGNSRNVPQTVVIKGYIVTLTSKLKLTPDLTWKLSVQVSDDTDCMDVDVHNDLLVKLMGATGSEYRELRKNAVASAMQDHEERLARFKERLRNMDGPMRIQFSGRDDEPPTLVAYEDSAEA